jgi:hypothetical protein
MNTISVLRVTALTAAASLSGVVSAHHEAFKASQVIGETLHNPRGEAIGEVEDLVVQNDEVLSAVVAVGGALGVGDKRVAIPAHELQYSHDDEAWHVEMTKDQLEALPAYDYAGVLRETKRAD